MAQDPGNFAAQGVNTIGLQCHDLQLQLTEARAALKKKEESLNAYFQGSTRVDPTKVEGISQIILGERIAIRDLEERMKKLGCEGSVSVNLADPQFIIGSSVPRRKSPFEISPA